MCAYAAGNVEHFKYLMKRLGYVFKKDAWMEVQAPGFKYYHQLAKMDEMFSEDMLRHHVDIGKQEIHNSSDVSGSIRLFSDVMKRLGIKLAGDELYEEFQRIYDESVGRDTGKNKMCNWGRGR